MKVVMTWEFPDNYRRAINARVGKSGLASRDECRDHVNTILTADAEAICAEEWEVDR